MDVKVLGRTIGIASGWDQIDEDVICFYDFEPNAKVAVPSGLLQVDMVEGILEVVRDVEEQEVDFISEGGLFDLVFDLMNDDGATQEVVFQEDIMKVLANVERDNATGTV